MRTRSSSNLVGESSPNPTTSNPKRRNRRRSKQPFSLEESPLDTMADQRTMAKLLHAPTEGNAEAIVVPPILVEHFELKHSLINMMTSDQFCGLEKDNPNDHIHLVSKIINEFFPPSRTTNLRNEISNFQQRFDESFHEAWDRYKDLLRACPQQVLRIASYWNTFYNALNPADQDSLNSAAGGNLLERRTQDVLTIIETNPSNDNSFEDIDYVEVSPPDSELVSLEEVKDDILREKLLNINLLIAKIESLNDNPTPDSVLKIASDYKDSRARGFVLRSLELQSLA
ncbi:reverse transcriptase domain-containing protein [Tanacetum coccineum]